MAQSSQNQELVDRFLRFYRNYYRDEIGQLAQRYPGEQRSLHVDYDDLYQFDPDLAEDYLAQPDQLGDYAEEALRVYDLPADVSLGQAHVRLRNLPDTIDIRSIRVHDNHVGRMIAVSGIIRKATDVRPKITEAAFECQRCGTMTYIPQTDGGFQEPHECQGCERQGPFRVNYDQSEFVDSQKLRVQESPEGLRGGETPQSIDIDIEDDITGEVTAGDHVTVTGVLHIDQVTEGNEKSQLFDLYMDGVSVEIEDEQFEDMEISEADKRDIIELSNHPDIYDEMVASVAPSIYGYDEEKLAMIFQLFAGVTKNLPDGSRIRGDLHMLLIGDPGTGKCLDGETLVTLADGREVPIRDLVERHLDDPTAVDDGVYDEADIDLVSVTEDGMVTTQRATRVWKREAPERMYRIQTTRGREIEATPSHPLFVQDGGHLDAIRADGLEVGDRIATPRKLDSKGDDTLDIDYRESKSPNAIRLDLPDRWTPRLARLVGFTIAEGDAIRRDDNTADIRVTNRDDEILSDVSRAFDDPGLTYTIDEPRTGTSARRVRCTASEFVSFLEELEPAILDGSAEQRVPEAIRTANELNRSQSELADGMAVSQTAVSYYERTDAVPDGGTVTSAKSVLLDRIDEALGVSDAVERLAACRTNDVIWDRVESIETVEPDDDWVYDLEVAGTHTYLANGIVSHNSQLLSYIRNIAPRSVYTSGKGSSSAGLTAAAVRDDFGEGQQWSLEAGALVLADQGIAAVDELDKMRPEDRSAMHQALEQQEISISKAGINATLKSRCSLLGAANPKYGRFDQYESIGEQIDLEPALISRFDLIFTVTDQPDPEEDAALAEHILRTNYAGELNTQREQVANSNHSQEEVEAVTDTVDPEIDPELLRKYVAYAKRTCFPTMTDEAKGAIRDFYVDLRAKGADEDAPVPVTARKLEALVRLAEASARVRLSDTVEHEDAERVIEIVRSCLQDIGVDPETGEFDADVIETGTSKSQRDRIKSIKDVIETVDAEYEGEAGAPIDAIVERAEAEGIDEDKVMDQIEQLRRKGDVYSPTTDQYKVV